VTPSFQIDSHCFKLQVATHDKWIFPQNETGPPIKASLHGALIITILFLHIKRYFLVARNSAGLTDKFRILD
jgi:hypothetical protein